MTCKNFCDERDKTIKKNNLKIEKYKKTRIKTLRKKLKTATKKQKLVLLEEMNHIQRVLKTVENDKMMEKINRDSCNKIYCNPGCKGTIFENNPKYPMENDFYTKLSKKYVEKIRKDGAVSGCMLFKPLSF